MYVWPDVNKMSKFRRNAYGSIIDEADSRLAFDYDS